MEKENIRNFSIIAHIDHGKSTLADRILEYTNAIPEREMKTQYLDNMDIERERGITIKLNTVKLKYKYNNKEYILNLIDTPGHVDFSYEVSRSLAACEGAILVVDAKKGIEAQTLANLYLAMDNDLTIIPVINKIDLVDVDIAKIKKELMDVLGFKEDEILLCSGKTGKGITSLIEAVIEKIPAPKIDYNKKVRALIYDSYFDNYKGVVLLIKVVEGILRVKDKIKMFATDKTYEITELGFKNPKEELVNSLKSGEVGFLVANIKDISSIHIGDTITLLNNPASERLKGYKSIKPMVYSDIYPTDASKYELLKESLNKLKLNDASLAFNTINSDALGFGFHIGFLGLLHAEIITSRLKDEFNLDVIATIPSVVFEVTLTDNNKILVDSPNKMPKKEKILKIEEPYVYTNIISPSSYIGSIMELCQSKRGIYKKMEYLNETRVNIHYEMPLLEIIYDFYDKLKSKTSGYASFDYELIGYKQSNLVKMNILLNGEVIDALSLIIHEDFAYDKAKNITQKLQKLIPRQMFQISIQASIGSKIIARENIKALRKNVLAKCYGGDISRKRKLLEAQKEGKKKMKTIGRVEIPNDVFISVLKSDD